MPRPRNPPRRRLQPADSAKMRGHANRSPAIAPHSARRKPGRNRRRLAAARSARRPRQIPRIVRAPIKKIVRLPGHQQFGSIGHAQNHRARRPQPRHQRSILRRHISRPQARPGLAPMSRHINRRLNRKWHAMQRPEFTGTIFAAHHSVLRRARLRQYELRLAIDKSIQARIKPRNALEMIPRDFNRRNFSSPNPPRDLRGGRQGRWMNGDLTIQERIVPLQSDLCPPQSVLISDL